MVTIRALDDGSTELEFRLQPDLVDPPISVVGEFNDWDPSRHRFEQAADGQLVATIVCPPGTRYEYRFLAATGWFDDPDAVEQIDNPFGSKNMVIDLTSGEPTVDLTLGERDPADLVPVAPRPARRASAS